MATITDEFDPLTIPKVLDQKVTRVLPDGKPAQAMLDYEQQLSAWMRANTANTNERFELVKEETDNAMAAVAVETEARIDGDTALASQITTVYAAIDDQMANGQIVFQAKAAPGGSTASYGLFLTAGSQFTGFEAIADSTYGSAIGMSAARFLFTDSGTSTPILGYSSGLWQFNTNVAIHGSLVVDGTINNAEIANRAVSQAAWVLGSGAGLVTVGITVRQDAYIVARGSNTGGTVTGTGIAGGTSNSSLYLGGSLIRSTDTPTYPTTFSTIEGITTPIAWGVGGASLEYVYGPLSAGSYSFSYGGAGEKTLILTELAK